MCMCMCLCVWDRDRQTDTNSQTHREHAYEGRGQKLTSGAFLNCFPHYCYCYYYRQGLWAHPFVHIGWPAIPGFPCLCLPSVKIIAVHHWVSLFSHLCSSSKHFTHSATSPAPWPAFLELDDFTTGTGLLGNRSPSLCSVSCGSTDLLSSLLLVNPIKQALSGTSVGLLLL